ncbi:MAG TPA: hypothetical protein VKX25_11595 [Bryobacteraceae bacterium]|jgi:hypothetical protein|nr:hypothetical protein [Bryobacteraceae bacterium]
MRRATLISFAVLAATLASQTGARATTLSYSVYSQWLANVTGSTELNFNGLTLYGSYNTSAGKTLQPLTGTALPFVFTGPTLSGAYQLTANDFGPYNALSFFGPANGNGTITIAMPTGGVNAVFLGLGTTGSSGPITVALSDGETFTVNASPNTYAFLGLSISHTINWITVASPNQPNLNDFFFASSKLTQDPTQTQAQAPASECATFFLMGGSLVILAGARRRLFPAFLRM